MTNEMAVPRRATGEHTVGPVVTYRLCYTGHTVSLCRAHAETHAYPLGEVSHGEHYGLCHDCDRRR